MYQDPMTELSGDVRVCQDKDWGVATGFDNGKLIIDPEKSNLVKVIWAKPWCQWTQWKRGRQHRRWYIEGKLVKGFSCKRSEIEQ